MPIAQKEQIFDSIIYSAEHETEFYGLTNKVTLAPNATTITFYKSFLPLIDKTSDRYKNGLVEGVTPAPEQINIAEYNAGVMETGWLFKFTRKSLAHSWVDLKGVMTKYLQNIFSSYHDEKIADEYFKVGNVISTAINILKPSSTITVDSAYEDLLRLNSILYANKAQTFDGYYRLYMAPEAIDRMVVVYKDLITHTTQKEALVKGEIGELAGFKLIKSRLQAFKPTVGETNSSYPFLAMGKSDRGQFAVTTVAYDGLNSHIFFNDFGKGEDDALHQRGSLGLYVDGHGFFVADDSCAIRGKAEMPKANTVTPFDSGTNGSKQTGFVKAETAFSNLYPSASTIELKVGGTYTIGITDEDGDAVSTGLTFESGNTAVATVSNTSGSVGKVTAVSAGSTLIVVKQGSGASLVQTSVTVKVVKA